MHRKYSEKIVDHFRNPTYSRKSPEVAHWVKGEAGNLHAGQWVALFIDPGTIRDKLWFRAAGSPLLIGACDWFCAQGATRTRKEMLEIDLTVFREELQIKPSDWHFANWILEAYRNAVEKIETTRETKDLSL